MQSKERPAHLWKPGQSGNPKGRLPSPFALSDLARAKVDKGELIDIFVRIARGEPLVRYLLADDPKVRVCRAEALPEGAKSLDMTFPTTADQRAAAEFLWDKIEPPTKSMALDVTTKDKRTAPDFSKMSPESLDRWLQLSMEMRKLTEGSGAIDVESTETGNKA